MVGNSHNIRTFSAGVLLLFLLFSGCSSVTVSDYAEQTPKLIPEEFFNGTLVAHGVVKNRNGQVIRYFNANILAYWEGAVGTLEEDFVFDDGEEQRRVWTLMHQGHGQYIGTAGDVIGEARGAVAGNSMFLKYVLEVPYKNSTIHLKIDDRMYLVNPNVLINESKMMKFGLEVGSLLLVIKKQD